MHSAKLVLSLFGSIIWFLVSSKCISNEIIHRTIVFSEEEIVEAINSSNILFTPTETDLASVDLKKLGKSIYSDIDKYKIGSSILETNILQVRLPVTSDTTEIKINSYLSFMLSRSKQLGEFVGIHGFTKVINAYLISTAPYCNHILCSGMETRSITVSAYELFLAYLNYFKKRIDGKKIIQFNYESVINNLTRNNFIKNIVKRNKKFNKGRANYFVFICKQDSVFEFVKRCISKVKTSNVNEILSEILSHCESKQTLNNRLVCWSEIISEIEEYSYFNAESKYQRMEAGEEKGGVRVDVGEFDLILCLEAFKKFNLQFTDIIYNPRLTSIDTILKRIDLALEADPQLIVYLNENIVDFFTEIVMLIDKEEMKHYSNLLTIDEDKFQLVEIPEDEFDSLVKIQLKKNSISLFITNFNQIYAENSKVNARKIGNSIEFLEFPFIDEENYDAYKVLQNYAHFVKNSVGDEKKNYVEVMKEVKRKFWGEETMEAYGESLKQKLIKEIKNDFKCEPKHGTSSSSKQKFSALCITLTVVGSFIIVILVLAIIYFYRKTSTSVLSTEEVPPSSSSQDENLTDS